MENKRIDRAKLSLEGLNIGDCFGETFFTGFAGFRDKASSIEELTLANPGFNSENLARKT